jgi:hypothetical protein
MELIQTEPKKLYREFLFKKKVKLKRRKHLSNLRVLVDFERNKQDCLQVFYSNHKINFFVIIFIGSI